MKDSDLDTLRRIGPTWTVVGTPNSSYALRAKVANPPSRSQLRRLKASGFIHVRTVTIRNWFTDEDRRNWFTSYGLRLWGDLRDRPDLMAEYNEAFTDKVEIQARLTPTGVDALTAHFA